MASEKQEIKLIVQCHDQSSLEFRKRWEECLEHPPDGMAEACCEVVENELRLYEVARAWPCAVVRKGYGTSIKKRIYLFCKLHRCEPEIRRWSAQ